MAATPEKLYRAHVYNLRAVSSSFDCILRELNGNLARKNVTTSDALLKTAMLLLGAWAENRLRKLVFEPNGFTAVERSRIDAAITQLECWKCALELGFRRRHQLPYAHLEAALPITSRARYQILYDILNNDLRPVIEARNKLAHGQWIRPLNNSNDDFSPHIAASINGENALTVKSKKRILESLARLIHDLVAGNDAFERDFDTHYQSLENAKRDITTRSYDKWLLAMTSKYERGRQTRNQWSGRIRP